MQRGWTVPCFGRAMLALPAALLLLLGLADARSGPPSIIFILSDDLGFGDYEISEPVPPQGGQGRIQTPNIVRLANGGMRFLQSYSGPICAPSRTVLMTGKHMGHTTIRGNDGACELLLLPLSSPRLCLTRRAARQTHRCCPPTSPSPRCCSRRT